jgi:predicted amidohydrolase YtcJ
MSIATGDSKISMIEEKIGLERGKYYWNRRRMADCGVALSCGTDLPLMIPDIPESIYHGCYGLFPEGGEPFNKENNLTIEEMLTAWTKGGQYNLYYENFLGTLEEGKLADIAVLDNDIFSVDIDKLRDVKVCLTIVNGKIVYSTL